MHNNCSEDVDMLSGQTRKKIDFVQAWVVFIARGRERRRLLTTTRIMALSPLITIQCKAVDLQGHLGNSVQNRIKRAHS